MKDFNVKNHTNKYLEKSKQAANSMYPNKKIARTGSYVGIGVGGILICVGIYGLTKSTAFGMGSLTAGVVAAISNTVNLKRINSK